MPDLDKLDSNKFAVSYESFLRDCPHCKNAIPLCGPTSQAQCPECLSDVPIPVRMWDTLFERTIDLDRWLDKEFDVQSDPFEISAPQERFKIETRCTLHAAPLCIHCGAPAPSQSLSASVDCASCGKKVAYVPLEKNFEGMLVTHVCATGLDGEASGSTPIDLPEKAAPIAMDCPLCSANLQVTSDSSRTITCEYCSGNIFLPDALWRRFHPVKTVKRWTTANEATPAAFLSKAKRTAFQYPLFILFLGVFIGGGIIGQAFFDANITLTGGEIAMVIGVILAIVVALSGRCVLRSRRYFAAARRFR